MWPLLAYALGQSLFLLLSFLLSLLFLLLLLLLAFLLFLSFLLLLLLSLLLLFLLGAWGESGAMGKRLDVRPALSDKCKYFGPLISFLGDGVRRLVVVVLCGWVLLLEGGEGTLGSVLVAFRITGMLAMATASSATCDSQEYNSGMKRRCDTHSRTRLFSPEVSASEGRPV